MVIPSCFAVMPYRPVYAGFCSVLKGDNERQSLSFYLMLSSRLFNLCLLAGATQATSLTTTPAELSLAQTACETCQSSLEDLVESGEEEGSESAGWHGYPYIQADYGYLSHLNNGGGYGHGGYGGYGGGRGYGGGCWVGGHPSNNSCKCGCCP